MLFTHTSVGALAEAVVAPVREVEAEALGLLSRVAGVKDRGRLPAHANDQRRL